MVRTVFANNRNFSHKGSGDKSIAGAPDVCKTPIGNSTPPIPYGISSQASNLDGATKSVTIDGYPTAIASSIHTICSGDQAGSANGLVSGTVGDKTHFSTYSFDVRCEGEGAVRHMDSTTMNNKNTIGGVDGVTNDSPVLAEDAIEITFRRKPRSLRHDWWPQETTPGYGYERYQMQHTSGNQDDSLSGQGEVMKVNIPPGNCSIKFPDFYTEIESWFSDRLN